MKLNERVAKMIDETSETHMGGVVELRGKPYSRIRPNAGPVKALYTSLCGRRSFGLIKGGRWGQLSKDTV